MNLQLCFYTIWNIYNYFSHLVVYHNTILHSAILVSYKVPDAIIGWKRQAKITTVQQIPHLSEFGRNEHYNYNSLW